jgi:hypothetical protein
VADIDPFIWFSRFMSDIFGLKSATLSRKRKHELEKTDESRKKQLCLAVDEVEAALFRLKQVGRSLSASIPDSTEDVREVVSEEESSCSESVDCYTDEDWDSAMVEDSQGSEFNGSPYIRPCKYGVPCNCETVGDSCDSSNELRNTEYTDLEGRNDSPSSSVCIEEYLMYDREEHRKKAKDIPYTGTPEIQVEPTSTKRPHTWLEDSLPTSSPSYMPPSTPTDNVPPSFNFSSSPTVHLSSSSYVHDQSYSQSPRNANPYSLDSFPSFSPSTSIKQESPPSEPLSSDETLRSDDFGKSPLFIPGKQADSFVISRTPSRSPKHHSQNVEQNMKVKRLLTQYTIAEFQAEAPQDIYLPVLTPTDIELDKSGSTHADGQTEMSHAGDGGKVWDAKVVEWGNDKTVRLIRVEND